MTPKQLVARNEALARSRDILAKIPQLTDDPKEWDSEQKEKAVVLLRAGGATYETIRQELGISSATISDIMQRDENVKLMALIREASKLEAVANGLAIQRKYLDWIRLTPITERSANAHKAIVQAYATIFDKAALAAGEATERTESKILAITVQDKENRLAQLREAQEIRLGREQYSSERVAEAGA